MNADAPVVRLLKCAIAHGKPAQREKADVRCSGTTEASWGSDHNVFAHGSCGRYVNPASVECH